VTPFTFHQQKFLCLGTTYWASTLRTTCRTPSTPLPSSSSSSSGSSRKSDSFEKLPVEFLRSGGGYEAFHVGELEWTEEDELLSAGSIIGEAVFDISVALVTGVRTIRRRSCECERKKVGKAREIWARAGYFVVTLQSERVREVESEGPMVLVYICMEGVPTQVRRRGSISKPGYPYENMHTAWRYVMIHTLTFSRYTPAYTSLLQLW